MQKRAHSAQFLCFEKFRCALYEFRTFHRRRSHLHELALCLAFAYARPVTAEEIAVDTCHLTGWARR